MTEADRASERAMREILARERPDDAILGADGAGRRAAHVARVLERALLED